jgi:hypothetical protein
VKRVVRSHPIGSEVHSVVSCRPIFQKNSKCFRRIKFLLHLCTGLYANVIHMFQKKR